VDRLFRLKRQGVTLVLTTHYMDEAEQLCDRLVVMDGGRIVAEGSPRALIDEWSTREVLELRFPDDDHGPLASAVEGLGERVEVLPDRLLVYTDDGDAAAEAVADRGLRPLSVLVRRSTQRILGPSRRGSKPSTRSSPPDGRDTQPIIRIVEDLAAPFGPRNAKASPRRTSTSMPPTA